VYVKENKGEMGRICESETNVPRTPSANSLHHGPELLVTYAAVAIQVHCANGRGLYCRFCYIESYNDLHSPTIS
jgi:hypothetical protein